MAQCVNINSKEFIALTRETDMNPVILAAKIALYQERTGINDRFPTIEEIRLGDIIPISKGEDIRKLASMSVEEGFEAFYSGQSTAERNTTDHYLNYLAEERTDDLATTEDKIERMQQAFDAVVLIDNDMDVSGKLLGTNNPISQRNDGKPVIMINSNKLFADTVFHEFGHLYIDLLGGMQDSLVQDAVEMLKGTSLWFSVQDAYPELNAENLAKEVLATALGIEGDMLFENQPTKKTIWEQLKAFIISTLSKLLNKNPNAIQRLATEMLTNKVRISEGASFNTLIDQNSKLVITGKATQKKIDTLFNTLTNRFTLKETLDDRFYKDKETGVTHNKSVSAFAKALTTNYYGARKGDYTIAFDKGTKLTAMNYKQIINGSVMPMALDQAFTDFFNGDIPSDLPITKERSEYWYRVYKKNLKAGDKAVFDYDQIIEGNLATINERAAEIEEDNKKPLQAGNEIHKALENYINERVKFPDHIIDTRNRLFKFMKKLIEEGEAKGSKFYSEQMLFSEAAETPGTADLIEITKDGRYRIYDFKTMSTFLNRRMKVKNAWEMYVSNGYLNQIMIYSTILEEYGIQPAEDHLNILAIEIDKSEVITGDLTSPITIDQFRMESMLAIANQPGERNFANHIKRSSNSVLGAFRRPKKTDTEDGLIEDEIQDIDRLAAKLERAVVDFAALKTDLGQTRTFDELGKEFEGFKGKKNKQIVLKYIKNIRKALASVYGASVSKEDFLSSAYLRDLEFLVQAASYLPDIRLFLTDQSHEYSIDNNDRDDLISLLEETEEALSELLKFQDYKTKEKTVEIMVANSNFMEGLWAEKYEMDARAKLTNPTKDQITEYVSKELIANASMINKREFDYWARIFKNGYTDIRYLEYLIADPGMNKSQFVQITKNVLDKTDMYTRMDLDESMADLVSWYDKLKGVVGDPKKVWGKFVETATYQDNDGVKHSHMNYTLIPEFTSDYRELHMRYSYQFDYYDREILKARKEGNTKKYELLLAKVEKFTEQKKIDLKGVSKTSRIHPSFAKLSEEDKKTLKWIHNKIEVADARLTGKHYSKLAYTVADEFMVYKLPRQRKSALEAAYEGDGVIKRFTSGLKDYLRPAADEDDMSLTRDEANILHSDFKTNSTDIVGDPLYEVPIYYRNALEDPTLQSFDIPTLLAMNEETTIQYEHYSSVEADLFMITQSLKNTKANKTDNIVNKMIVDRHKGGLAKTLRSPDNLVLKAVQASINNRLYKRTYSGVYSKTNYRLIKGAEGLNKATSMILLAGNFGSASMTSLQGSIYRTIEGIAGEDFTMEDVKKGSMKAWADIHNVIADSQKQFPTSLTSLLIRRFGLETQYKALVNKFVQDNIVTKNLDEASIFSLTTMAETIVTSSLMYTLLNNIKVMNTNGDFINAKGNKVTRKNAMSLDEAYSVEEGKLVLNKKVSYTEHNLITKYRDNINGEKTIPATQISSYIRSKYADLYGQYNQDMKSVAEMHVIGKLVFSMKKWIPRGYHRRWRGINSVRNTFAEMREETNLEKRFYSQDQRKFQEGYYVTGLRYGWSLMQAMKDKEVAFGAAIKTVNGTLSTHERANLIRLASELGIIAITIAAALLARVVALDMGDDDEYKDAVYFAAYLAERVKIESLTFINLFDLMNNLENPAAAINTISNTRKLLWQMFGFTYDKDMGEFDWEFNNEYKKGERKGEWKVLKRMQVLFPGYKKISQFMGILGLDSKESIEESFEFMIRN